MNHITFEDLKPRLLEYLVMLALAALTLLHLHARLAPVFTTLAGMLTLGVLALVLQSASWLFITRTTLLLVLRAIFTSDLPEIARRVFTALLVVFCELILAGLLAMASPYIFSLPGWINGHSFFEILLRVEIGLIIVNLIPWGFHVFDPKFNLLEEKPL